MMKNQAHHWTQRYCSGDDSLKPQSTNLAARKAASRIGVFVHRNSECFGRAKIDHKRSSFRGSFLHITGRHPTMKLKTF